MSAHHPDKLTLLEYSAGSLALPKTLAVAVHLFLCNHCRQQTEQLNALGGSLLENAEADDVQVPDFASLMAHIQASEATPTHQAAREHSPTHHNPLERYLPESLHALPWRKQTRRISEFDLTERLQVKGYRIALKKINAGARVPEHTHRGTELTVILSGGFSDELGVYHEGDFIARDGSHRHAPTALQNEDCICLTVLDAPIHFVGPLYRLLNPFMAW